MDEGLAHPAGLLRRNQTIPALVLSRHLALMLGWDWSGAAGHLTVLYSNRCWDQIAFMATLLDTSHPAFGEAGCVPAKRQPQRSAGNRGRYLAHTAATAPVDMRAFPAPCGCRIKCCLASLIWGQRGRCAASGQAPAAGHFLCWIPWARTPLDRARQHPARNPCRLQRPSHTSGGATG